MYDDDMDVILTYWTEWKQQFTRLCVGILLHLSQVDSAKVGLDQMKFSLNHAYLFTNPSLAAVIAFV
jgi:hypothetical protein